MPPNGRSSGSFEGKKLTTPKLPKKEFSLKMLLRRGVCLRASVAGATQSHRCASASFSSTTITDATMQPKSGGGSVSDKGTRLKRVLSGVQPTGMLHIGNYLGAIRTWVANQDIHDNYFCVVDLHAITAPHNPKQLREDSLSIAAMYLAAGIDPAKSKIFIQSHVSAHSELAWLLTCITPMGWLERMIQYKEKALRQGESTGMGLFAYPVLMAADILLYQTDLVPVGEDQRQHLELTRDISRRFNDQFCKKVKRVFKEPTALIASENAGARVMSLLDGTQKMSKSHDNDNTRINMLDSPAVIHSKIKRCKTDLFVGLEFDHPDRPECTNLLNMYVAVSGKSKQEVAAETRDMSWGQFKPLLAEALVAHLTPIQQRYAALMADEAFVEQVLEDGAVAAEAIAEETLIRAKLAMGFHIKTTTKK